MFSQEKVRDFSVSLLMGLSFLWAISYPAQKSGLRDKIHLASLIPQQFEGWSAFPYDTAGFQDSWQSINELYLAEYEKEDLYSLLGPGAKRVGLAIEYSSDLRNNFSFHFPENCHRAGGNQVDFLKPLEVPLPGGRIFRVKLIFIRGVQGTHESVDKLVAYWLVMDGKHHYETLFVKLDQMMAGLLSGAKTGVLVRVDFFDRIEYSKEGMKHGREVLRKFIQDFYYSLDAEKRELFFGKES